MQCHAAPQPQAKPSHHRTTSWSLPSKLRPLCRPHVIQSSLQQPPSWGVGQPLHPWCPHRRANSHVSSHSSNDSPSSTHVTDADIHESPERPIIGPEGDELGVSSSLQGQTHALPAPGDWAGMVASWPAQPLEPGLYVVGTPIGNLADITLRALSVLRSVNLILAEDTRHSLKLLNHFGIRSELMSCHEHNEQVRIQKVLQRLQQGEPVALISDAGMPGISDPGSVLIKAVIEAGLTVIPIPGASAFVCALVASGLDTSNFTFLGFLPPKSGARRTQLEKVRTHTATLAFYTPPHGLCATLADMVAVLGSTRRVCVARELTKRHEELYRSDLQGALETFQARQPRGEFCLIVEGASQGVPRDNWQEIEETGNMDGVAGQETSAGEPAAAVAAAEEVPIQVQAEALMRRMVGAGLSRSDAAKEAAKRLGLKKKDLYSLAVQMKL